MGRWVIFHSCENQKAVVLWSQACPGLQSSIGLWELFAETRQYFSCNLSLHCTNKKYYLACQQDVASKPQKKRNVCSKTTDHKISLSYVSSNSISSPLMQDKKFTPFRSKPRFQEENKTWYFRNLPPDYQKHWSINLENPDNRESARPIGFP